MYRRDYIANKITLTSPACTTFFDHELLSFTLKDHKGQVSYIATQHPLHETTEDFWRMVWDQKAHTVVMVNNEEEENPVRLAPNMGGDQKLLVFCVTPFKIKIKTVQ